MDPPLEPLDPQDTRAAPAGGPEAAGLRGAAVNEALLISGLREHELREKAEALADECVRLMDVAHLATLAAEKANGAKDLFLATLSHELRTPLNPALLIASEGAQNPDLAPEVRRNFAAIAKNIQLEAHLIDELLDFTKIARGKITLNMTMVSVRDVLRDALANVHGDFAERQLRVECVAPAEDLLLDGDPLRLQQVFWNVLKNAAKFSRPGGSIVVRTEHHPGASTVTLRFTDTGIGIEPSELELIFEPFEQSRRAPGAPPPPQGGLGLGLSIAKNIVELHGGSMRADSPGLGSGSTFTIELPVGRLKIPSQPSAAGPGSAPGRKHYQNGLRVLFAEDEPDSRAAIQRLLVTRGIQVSSVGTFAEAQRVGNLNRFDLLIADIALPDGNGLDLLRLLARHSPRIRGVTLSGFGSEAHLSLSRRAGFAAHLVKPIQIDLLESALDAALGSEAPFPGAIG